VTPGTEPAPGWYYYSDANATTVYVSGPGHESDTAMTVASPSYIAPDRVIGFRSDKHGVIPGDIYVVRFYMKVDDDEPASGDFSIRARSRWY
jgi:hypothetical protein